MMSKCPTTIDRDIDATRAQRSSDYIRKAPLRSKLAASWTDMSWRRRLLSDLDLVRAPFRAFGVRPRWSSAYPKH
ncbi:MAG: hypothetical protein JNL45_07025 [Hyphomicrobium sp.]|jgi:hypothetical protein|nr:hypothetical protein [Hyphomicrobium sp.]